MTPILLQTENGARPVQVAFLSFRDAKAYIRDVTEGLKAQGIAISIPLASELQRYQAVLYSSKDHNMFASHQPSIGAYGRDNPDNMAHVLTFVLMTIQQALHTIPQAMASVRKEGEKSRFLWGFKTSAWNEIQKSKALIYDHSMNLYYGHANPEHAERELLYFFSHMKGMGLAKGGFAVQLLFGLSGCLDSHNIARLGYDPREFKASRYKLVKDARRKAQFLDVYIDLCGIAGGTASLWDEWCNYVYEKQPIFYRSGEHVSELHLKALNLGG